MLIATLKGAPYAFFTLSCQSENKKWATGQFRCCHNQASSNQYPSFWKSSVGLCLLSNAETHGACAFTWTSSFLNTKTHRRPYQVYLETKTNKTVLLTVLVLGAMVLVNSYTGIVISSLTTTNMKPSIDSLEELAASTETQVLLRHDTSIGEQMLVLADKARLIPGNIVGDAVKVTEKLETGRYAFPFIKTFAMSFVSSQFEKDQQCRFKCQRNCHCQLDTIFGFLKRTVCIPMLTVNVKLLELWETGLTNFWVFNLFPPTTPRAEQCFVESTRRVSCRTPIQLSDLTSAVVPSAFLILGIGTGLAFLSFLTELLYSRFRLCTLPLG
ncbi:hypothetical protein GHT06_008139 [Daphnia sinensis]|uniref:Ionotropic glutamate receptor C-terminal domain-containing protein n=1 Tax=Daphnia sinensis TaxID=1820382 RepID=A0AAD5LKH3_9CRUS|nr:hypothetical protein GHT06_008139 [Daphnia sinensis]